MPTHQFENLLGVSDLLESFSKEKAYMGFGLIGHSVRKDKPLVDKAFDLAMNKLGINYQVAFQFANSKGGRHLGDSNALNAAKSLEELVNAIIICFISEIEDGNPFLRDSWKNQCNKKILLKIKKELNLW